MNEIFFTIYGNPKALKRHRTFRRGNFVGQYDPSSGDKADFLAMALKNKPTLPLECPLKMELLFYFDRPKNHYRTGKYAKQLKSDVASWHTSSPDCDNLVKFVCDSLNGIFYKDDRIISQIIVTKKYDNIPRTEIKITPLNNQYSNQTLLKLN